MVDTVVLCKSTDFSKILPIVPEMSFLAVKRKLMVWHSIQDHRLRLVVVSRRFSLIWNIPPVSLVTLVFCRFQSVLQVAIPQCGL